MDRANAARRGHRARCLVRRDAHRSAVRAEDAGAASVRARAQRPAGRRRKWRATGTDADRHARDVLSVRVHRPRATAIHRPGRAGTVVSHQSPGASPESLTRLTPGDWRRLAYRILVMTTVKAPALSPSSVSLTPSI